MGAATKIVRNALKKSKPKSGPTPDNSLGEV